MPSRTKIVLAFASIYVIWGSTYLGIRIAIETIPPLIMAGIRYAAAGALLYAWTAWPGGERPTRAHWRSAAIVGTLLLLGGNGAVSWSELHVPTGLAALLISTVPLWIVVLQWLRPGGVRPRAQVLAGIVLGLVGLALLVAPRGHAPGERTNLFACAVLIAGALSWSSGSLLSRRMPLPKSPLLGIAMEMLCGGAALVLGGLAIGEGGRFHPAAISPRSTLAMIYLITFGSLIGFTCYVWLMRVSTPSKVATYAFVNPVVAVFLGWLFLGEPITTRLVLPAAIIVAAVALITLSPPRETRAALAPHPERGQHPAPRGGRRHGDDSRSECMQPGSTPGR